MAWLSDEDWMKCGGAVPDLIGKEWYGGLDLASTSDTNAFTLVFPVQVGLETMCSLHYFWIPEEVAERKAEIADYPQWVRDGFVKATEGNVMDHKVMQKDIGDLITKSHRFQVIQNCILRA